MTTIWTCKGCDKNGLPCVFVDLGQPPARPYKCQRNFDSIVAWKVSHEYKLVKCSALGLFIKHTKEKVVFLKDWLTLMPVPYYIH